MRLHRFYVSQPLGEDVVITDVSLIKQLSKVFRYAVGDFVILFNGDGFDVTYGIETISNKEITLVKKSQTSAHIPTKKITLCLSIIKKDNFELVVQKATELGVSTIIPILSERSEKKNLSIERLNKIAIEASEQCGRGDVPTILPVISLETMFAEGIPYDKAYFFQMHGSPLSKIDDTTETVILFVGPEGGWSEKEIEKFEMANIKSVELGQTVLRAETAAIVGTFLVSTFTS